MNNKLNANHSPLFKDAPLTDAIQICVVIPVKNEEDDINECLGAFLNQVDNDGDPIDNETFEILILANNCTDRSVQVIQQFKEENPNLNVHLEVVNLDAEYANIGYVRKRLMDTAYGRLCKNGKGIMMTTDGDTVVSKDWIYQNTSEIKSGADCVGGRILLKEKESLSLDSSIAVFYKKDEEYQLLISALEAMILQNFDFEKPCHHQHFNGSFAITSDCYRKAGGLPEVRHLEDCAFYERLLSVDANIRHSNAVEVQTSARHSGRAAIGLAYQLMIWKNMETENPNFLVESCESLIHRFTTKRKLMNLWHQKKKDNVLLSLALVEIDKDIIINEEIIENYTELSYFGQWFNQIKDLNEIRWRLTCVATPINLAIQALRKKIANYSN
ncbi:MAG: glycosyltransferase [Pelobium sp.]